MRILRIYSLNDFGVYHTVVLPEVMRYVTALVLIIL